mmetsp:Transcript_24293/g.41481  ORF Transcript_24293/g.41481 Transcript_24293/m.41481 type:complete len:578 (+) Transcript_24293:18-1751(+)
MYPALSARSPLAGLARLSKLTRPRRGGVTRHGTRGSSQWKLRSTRSRLHATVHRQPTPRVSDATQDTRSTTAHASAARASTHNHESISTHRKYVAHKRGAYSSPHTRGTKPRAKPMLARPRPPICSDSPARSRRRPRCPAIHEWCRRAQPWRGPATPFWRDVRSSRSATRRRGCGWTRHGEEAPRGGSGAGGGSGRQAPAGRILPGESEVEVERDRRALAAEGVLPAHAGQLGGRHPVVKVALHGAAEGAVDGGVVHDLHVEGLALPHAADAAAEAQLVIVIVVGRRRLLPRHPRVAQRVLHRGALRRLDEQQPVEQVDRLGREVARVLLVPREDGRHRRLACPLRLGQLLEPPVAHLGLVHGEEAVEQAEHADAQRPHVRHKAVVAAADEHFGRGVRLAAAEALDRLRAVDVARGVEAVLVREAEVDHLDDARLVQEHILELEVAVRHATLVAVLDAGEQLEHEAADERLGHGAVVRGELVEELAAGRALHEDEVQVPVLALPNPMVLEADDVLMAPASVHELALLDDEAQLHLPGVDDLDHQVLSRLPVLCGKGGAVAAFPEALGGVDRIALEHA